jgi:hypothetical protein
VGGHGIGYISCSLQRKFARMFLGWLFQIAANLLPATSNKGWAVKKFTWACKLSPSIRLAWILG